jgi:alkylation response protein AidB-like acyl-CoA dehydrogenase
MPATLTAAARGAWDGMIELGFAGILIPEEFSGVGLDSRAEHSGRRDDGPFARERAVHRQRGDGRDRYRPWRQ